MSRDTRFKFIPIPSFRRRLRPPQPSSPRRDVESYPRATKFPAAQLLPQELLLIITADLLLAIGYAAFAYADLHIPFVYDYVKIPSFRKATADLLSVIRVCKSWNIAGTEALYARPHLTSQYRVWCFNRTLKNNPSLASLVRQVFVLQPIASSRLPTSRDTLRPQKDTGRAQSDFAASLLACQSLETLTFTVYHGGHTRTFSSWDNEFIRELGSHLPTSLKKLAIFGRSAKAEPNPISLIPPSTSLPLLDHLKISNVQLEPNHDFPILPALRNLEIECLTHQYDPDTPFPLHLQSTKFPSLTTLTLCQTWAQIKVDEDCLCRLEELALYGADELEYYLLEVQNGTLDEIKELTLSFDYHDDGELLIHRLPRGLNTLTFFGNFTGTKSNHPEAPPVGPLKDFIGSFASAASSCTSLKSLEFNMGTFEDQETSQYDAALNEVRALCSSRGITFDLTKYGKEQYLKSAEASVTEWLDY